MKKIILGAVLVLVCAIGIGVYFLLSNLDGLVKSAIENYGSQVTQTAVRVQSVKIGLKDGSGAIRGLTVGNPKGFSAPQVFSLGEIATQIDLKSLTSDVTVIEKIIVRAPEVFFELNGAGKNNLDELKQNITSGASGASASTSSSASAAKSEAKVPKLVIRKLLFAEGKIHARVVALNKDYNLKLPQIEMQNLGGKNGATPAQIADQVIKLLTDRALTEVQKQGLDQYKAKLKGVVDKRLDTVKQKINSKVGDKLGEQVGDKLKGLLKY